MNIQDHNFTLNRGEQIKSIKVFTSFESQFIIGLQFKTTTNRDSQIFGQNSRFNYEIKSPYSSRYFVEYLHGKSDIYNFLNRFYQYITAFPVSVGWIRGADIVIDPSYNQTNWPWIMIDQFR